MNEQEKLWKAAEVKLSYKTKIRASDRTHIKNSEDAANVFFEAWNWELIEFLEEVKLLLLNRANRVLGIADLSQGGITGSVIDVRIILQYALKSNASAVILAHNHPSGNLTPSESDIQITEKVSKALELLDLKLLDHIIICKDRLYSCILA